MQRDSTVETTCACYGQHPCPCPASTARYVCEEVSRWLPIPPGLWGLPSWVPKYCGGRDKPFPLCCVQMADPLNPWVYKMVTLHHWVWVVCYIIVITGTGMEIQKGYIIFLPLHGQEMAGLGSEAGLAVLFLLCGSGDWRWGSEGPKPARTQEGTTQ